MPSPNLTGAGLTSVLTVAVLMLAFAPGANADASEVWTQAARTFDAGAAKLSTRPDAAAPEFLRAAALYALVASDQTLSATDRSRAEFNRGNALFLADRHADALLAFRRAERARPWNPAIAENLGATLKKLEGVPAPVEGNRTLKHVRAALALLPLRILALAGVAFLSAALLAASVRILTTRGSPPHTSGPPRSFIALSAMLALVCLGILLASWTIDHRLTPSSAIVLAEGLLPRSGPDDLVYAPVSTTPLKAGTEVRLAAGARGIADAALSDPAAQIPPTWLEVVLPGTDGSDRSGWVPASGLGLINAD